MAEPGSITLPKKVKDLTGRTFGKLTVISLARFTPRRRAIWLCHCACGVDKEVSSKHLLDGGTRSCGCLEGRLVHGKSRAGTITKAYRTWANMIQRCTNSNLRAFQFYGARGITVCTCWLDFVNFLEDMGEPPTDDLTIERIDNDGNYEPGNCRWATKAEQQRNSRRNRNLTFHGKTQCLAEWARELGLPYKRLLQRLHKGWSTDAILNPSR